MRPAESRMIHRRLKNAINQRPNLGTCLGEGRFEICNDLLENAIRPTKLGAKN